MNAIVMMDYDYCIGINGDQVLHIRDDLQRFKELTTGKYVVYGRKTLETFPNKKPLPNRKNIIISETMNKMEALKYDTNTVIVNNIDDMGDYYHRIHGKDARINSYALFPDFSTYNQKYKIGNVNADFTLINMEDKIVKCKELDNTIRISYNEYVRL